ncbi:MAG: glycosyltransferase family 4 protein [Candidatus Omnitrophota bacterium]
MRIAFLTSEYITEANFAGGLANYLQRVAVGLSRMGHDVEIFVLTDSNGILKKDRVTINRVKFRPVNSYLLKKVQRTINILLGSYLLKKALLKKHRQQEIDVVQAASYLSVGLFLVRSKLLPTVTRISSFAPLWRAANGGFSYLSEQFFVEKLELIQMRKSQGLYAPSKTLCEIINFFEPLNIEVIRPPFTREHTKSDPGLFNKYAKGLDYLLFYGSIMPLKGVDFLLANLQNILEENPNTNFIFIGRYGREEQFKRAAGPFRERVIYLDSMQRSQLLPFIKGARAVILPSKIDNLPNSCLESMAEGKVVVTTYSSGFEDIITSGRNGFLIKYDESQQLLRCLKEICSMDKNQLEKIGQEAAETISEGFNEKRNLDLLINYYQMIISKWRNNEKYQ